MKVRDFSNDSSVFLCSFGLVLHGRKNDADAPGSPAATIVAAALPSLFMEFLIS